MPDPSARPARALRRALLVGAVAVVAGAGGGALYAFRDRYAGEELTPPEALAAVRAGDLTLVDIRRPDEWTATGLAEGAVALDMRRDDFEAALATLLGGDRDAPVALICAAGVRSDRMAARLAADGFGRIVDVPEGMSGSAAGPGWIARGLPIAAPPASATPPA